MPSVLTKPRRRTITVGPDDHGRRMSLDAFDRAVAQDGYNYELDKGVVAVSGIPNPRHLAQVIALRNPLIIFQVSNPGTIHTVAGSNESKVLLNDVQSERHPDLSVYLGPPGVTTDVWSSWVPAIAVEIVSKSSAKRDYDDKPAEYFAFGVDEYWIVDSFKQRLSVLTRWRGAWKTKVLKPTQTLSTPLLPGFSLNLKSVFDAAK